MGVAGPSCNPSTSGAQQHDCEFEASMNYRARWCVKRVSPWSSVVLRSYRTILSASHLSLLMVFSFLQFSSFLYPTPSFKVQLSKEHPLLDAFFNKFDNYGSHFPLFPF